MVEETVEDIDESLDWFLWIWGDLPLTSLMLTGMVPVEWSISVLLKVFTEGKRVRWLLDWIVELKEVGKLNLFTVSPIGATIQDGGKRKRSGAPWLSQIMNKNQVYCSQLWHICRIYKSNNKLLRYKTISNYKFYWLLYQKWPNKFL